MKIQRTYDSMPVSLEAWCDQHGFGVELYRCNDLRSDQAYRACLTPTVEEKQGCMLSSTYVWAATEVLAMTALAQRLSNKRLVKRAYHLDRQEYFTPTLQWLGQLP